MSGEGEHRKIRVAVVFGGRSSEHAVSCITAGSVLQAIDRDVYEVVPVGIAHDGRWVLTSGDPSQLAIQDGRLPAVDGTSGTALALPSDPASRGLVALERGSVPRELGQVDVVLPLLHGPYGEDGTIQGLFEMAGVPYVGAGVFASAASMDKAHMKRMFSAAGLPVGAYVVIRDREWQRERKRVVDEVAEQLGWPVFVKPARGGSSIGISQARDESELEAAVAAAREHDPKIVIEAALVGREVECGVLETLDGEAPQASLPAEISVRGEHDFYDFQAKYLDEATNVDIPAQLAAATIVEVQRLAVAAFEALACEGLARVDLFVTGDGAVVVNEINTMPGFTPTSAFPRMWAESDLDYPSLIDHLLRTALRRSTGLR